MNLKDYVQHYWRDFPTACHLEVENAKTHQITADVLQNLIISKTGLPEVVPPSIVRTLHTILKSKTLSEPFPIVGDVTSRTQDIVLVFALFTSKGALIEPSKFCSNGEIDQDALKSMEPDPRLGNPGRIIDYVVNRGFNYWTVQSIPIGFAVPILSSIYECRMSPPLSGSWKPEAYDLIGRPELNCTKQDFAKKSNLDKNDLKNLITNATTSDGSETVEDGLEDIENEVTKLRWPNDRRLSDVKKLLQSAKPVIIGVQQRPEVSDHDFVEEQERSLQSLCIRTMALPVGRGAISFQTANPLPTEPITIPRLCLSGKAPPRGNLLM